MRNRIEILKDLVLLQSSIEVLEKELNQYPWDIETPLLKVSKNDIALILKKCLDNEIDFKTLTNWANAIECRDDLDFSTEEIQEIIFEVANSEINEEVTKERLQEIVDELRG
jgi:hypothetical protein